MNAPAGPTPDELARLSRRLLEQERQTSRCLAHTLHDELGQTLAALRLHWEACRGAATPAQGDMEARITHLVVLANRQVRAMLAELSPPLLDELGLAAALDNEIRQQQGASGEPRVALRVAGTAQLQRWPADVEYAAFMIVREALQRALHGEGCATVHVNLDGDDGLLELQVTGEGGAPAAQAPRPVGMRERALAIGASLHVDDTAGQASIVALTWMPPVDEPPLPD